MFGFCFVLRTWSFSLAVLLRVEWSELVCHSTQKVHCGCVVTVRRQSSTKPLEIVTTGIFFYFVFHDFDWFIGLLCIDGHCT